MLPVEKVGSKKLLPENSVMTFVSMKQKPISPKITSAFQTEQKKLISNTYIDSQADAYPRY